MDVGVTHEVDTTTALSSGFRAAPPSFPARRSLMQRASSGRCRRRRWSCRAMLVLQCAEGAKRGAVVDTQLSSCALLSGAVTYSESFLCALPAHVSRLRIPTVLLQRIQCSPSFQVEAQSTSLGLDMPTHTALPHTDPLSVRPHKTRLKPTLRSPNINRPSTSSASVTHKTWLSPQFKTQQSILCEMQHCRNSFFPVAHKSLLTSAVEPWPSQSLPANAAQRTVGVTFFDMLIQVVM
ncbi:uncharacterized protein B0I36DRAFT_147085 [Microdochium trichocladiopsis]|uniref:Uncharacterized protein n=1 Tax=Microdochium trichocladiopsis TaxID=1682393 RepID=A0A9P8Y1C5_9PEZI|nr:uncharacterized protein B0I36DRAFT_147085 [Microdochium trichocladiopsis]KAH7028093.1 hypothetical protein B0I36DRAFT_147085 [Microdochium trichocladiopsis]